MEAFAAFAIDHVLILRCLFFSLGAWSFWVAASGLWRGVVRNADWISIIYGERTVARTEEPLSYWIAIVQYSVFAASGLGLFAASYFFNVH